MASAALLLTSCYSSRVMIGSVEPNEPMVEVNKHTNHYLVAGLVPLGNIKKITDYSEYVGNAKNYEIRTEISFVNCLVTGLTSWIYAPTQTRYLIPLSDVNESK